MAANTDKFRKGARRFSTTLGSGGIADASATTFTLSSATGLPTDTAVDLVIDRVDSSGTLTPSKEEVITVVMSGTSATNAIRGVEGTAQAHSAGAVVEVKLTASTHDDMIDGILAEHGQDGSHGAIDATSIDLGSTTQVSSILDEDDMASDSATALATQQSIKAYVDAGDTAITGVDRCQAYTTSYSLASASEVAIPLDAESYDTNTMHDNATNNEDITVKTTGNYLVTANVSCTASLSDGHRFLVNIRKNDAALTNSDGRFDITVGGTSPATAQVSALVNATANDRFQVFAYQNSGTAKTVRATLTVQELPFD